MKVVELFAGCGGAALGLHRAGLEHIACVERDPNPYATLCAAGSPGVMADVADYVVETEHDLSNGAMWASPPCQPYSSVGKGLGSNDPRDGWPMTLQAVKKWRPRWIMVENVVLSPVSEWCDQLRSLGYVAEHRRINCADYGLPQHRKREIIVAGPRSIRWPKPTHGDPSHGLLMALGTRAWVTCRQALGVEVAMYSGAQDQIDKFVHDRKVTPLSDRPCVCITTKYGFLGRIPFSYKPDGSKRHLSIIERATLQGFPIDYPWQGSDRTIHKQIGNAVPPMLSELIGSSVLEADC